MGIYDRDYYRDPPRGGGIKGFFSGLLRNILWVIIGLNVLVFVFNGFLTPETNLVTGFLSMHNVTLKEPRLWFEFLTYGFAHAPNSFNHIFFNMLTLFFFARYIIMRYGALEFLLFYLLAILAGGLVWGVIHSGSQPAAMMGASGGVTAVVILFALNEPRATLFVWFIPMPAWMAAILFVALDIFGAGAMVAHDVHLTGAAFAALYFLTNFRFTHPFSRRPKRVRSVSSFKPRVRLHEPTPEDKRAPSSTADASIEVIGEPQPRPVSDLERKVDAILRKISRSGEESLTDEEREVLLRATREYQKRNRK